jgi:hypothetical protein
MVTIIAGNPWLRGHQQPSLSTSRMKRERREARIACLAVSLSAAWEPARGAVLPAWRALAVSSEAQTAAALFQVLASKSAPSGQPVWVASMAWLAARSGAA